MLSTLFLGEVIIFILNKFVMIKFIDFHEAWTINYEFIKLHKIGL